MNTALIPLIGPIINGAISLFAGPKKFVKETAKTKTTAAGALVAGVTLAAPQTEEQAITAIVGGVLSLCLMLYKEHKEGDDKLS